MISIIKKIICRRMFFSLLLVSYLKADVQQVNAVQTSEKPLAINVVPSSYEKMDILLGLMGNCSTELLEVAGLIKKDLEFSGQFHVVVRTIADMHAKKEVAQ